MSDSVSFLTEEELTNKVLSLLPAAPHGGKSALGLAIEMRSLIDKTVTIDRKTEYPKWARRNNREEYLEKIRKTLRKLARKGIVEKDVIKVKSRGRSRLTAQYYGVSTDLRGVGYRWFTSVAFYRKKETTPK